MTRLLWDQPNEKTYEVGVDRGVIFPPVGEGFVWNGLISVNETNDGGDLMAYYIDGEPYYIHSPASDFAATVEAYTYPPGLEPFIGEVSDSSGIIYTGQSKQYFNLSYRTMVGVGDSGLMEYKIHLIYNAKLSSPEKSYGTINESPEPLTFSWDLNAASSEIVGRRNTAHIVIDSRKVSRLALGVLEGYLYGANGVSPQMPSISKISTFFAQFANLTTLYPTTYRGSLDRDLSNNLIANSGFEVDTTGWFAANGTMVRTAGGNFDITGSAIDYFARLTSDGSGSTSSINQNARTAIPAGVTHVTFGMWVALDGSVNAQIRANISRTSGVDSFPLSAYFSAPWYEGKWISHTFELPPDATAVGLSVLMKNASDPTSVIPSGRRMWLDNVVMNWGITDGLFHDPFPKPWAKGDMYSIKNKLSVYDGTKWYRPSRLSLTFF